MHGIKCSSDRIMVVAASLLTRRTLYPGDIRIRWGDGGGSYKEVVKKAGRIPAVACLVSTIRIRAKPISDSRVGEDKPRSARLFFDLFPELANEDTQVLRLVHVGLSPDFLKQHAMG